MKRTTNIDRTQIFFKELHACLNNKSIEFFIDSSTDCKLLFHENGKSYKQDKIRKTKIWRLTIRFETKNTPDQIVRN